MTTRNEVAILSLFSALQSQGAGYRQVCCKGREVKAVVLPPIEGVGLRLGAFHYVDADVFFLGAVKDGDIFHMIPVGLPTVDQVVYTLAELAADLPAARELGLL